MKITPDQIEALREAALPLMQWLNDNCHPHCTILVKSVLIQRTQRRLTKLVTSIERTNNMNKPCPFCGSNELSYQVSTEDREGIPTNIFCQDCGCSGPWIYLQRREVECIYTPSQENDGSIFDPLPKRALELWNKRSERIELVEGLATAGRLADQSGGRTEMEEQP